ncbi:hypothetical protein OEZ86_008310 [Tetradesmus obliquus]|nr:hypothetical protein OEZ86_008310 [Tetradesmus obliquus]
MCFTQPASAFFAVMAFSTAAFLRYRGHPFRRWQMFAYFGLMEVIQFCSYFWIDQCDSPINKLLTMLAYTHVMYQNISVNAFFLSPEFGVHPDVFKLVTWMAVAGGSMGLITKLPWPVWLGASPTLLDPISKILPDIHSLTKAGTPESCMFENMCAPQVCTFSTPNHLAWSVPVMPPSYFLPNSFLHFFFFFAPTLIMANNLARAIMGMAFITGPVFTMALAARHMDTYKFEWPATWCYMSVAQCAIALSLELWAIYKLESRSSLRTMLLSGSSTPSTALPATNGKTNGRANGKANGKAL